MLIPADAKLFFSKNDTADPRLGELSKSVSLEEYFESALSWAIVGYPDDEGIRINGGRPGAALAPDQIRHFLYRMTPSLLTPHIAGVADLGNLSGKDLSTRHDESREISRKVHFNDKSLISLGGGHDYAYGDIAGFLDAYQNENPLVINFDAHLDVRPFVKDPHSGTPFYRLLEEFSGKFELVEIGIQNQCNSQAHLKWASSHGTEIILLDEVWQKGIVQALEPFLKSKGRPCFLSIDLDAFTSDQAPGCSQSWTTGLTVREFLDALPLIHSSCLIRGAGFYEVSPPLDQDNRTSKLAALLIHHLLFL